MRDCNGAFSFEGIELFSTSFEVALSSKHLRYCKLCSELNCSLMPKQTAMAEKTPPIVAHWTFYVIRNYLYRQGKSYCSIDVAGKHMMSTKTSLWMFPEGTLFPSKEPSQERWFPSFSAYHSHCGRKLYRPI